MAFPPPDFLATLISIKTELAREKDIATLPILRRTLEERQRVL